jgi:hypothetical protein
MYSAASFLTVPHDVILEGVYILLSLAHLISNMVEAAT